MPTSFPIYSHPLRAKVVMVKGVKGDTPTAAITKDSEGLITITITNPNDGHPTTDTATILTPSLKATGDADQTTITATDDFGTTTDTIVKPKARVDQTSTGAIVTISDGTGTTTAELANGVSISSARISSDNHLIITMSNGTEVDTGEIPVGALEVVDTITLDGTTKTYTMTADVPQDDVAYILINGLVNTDGFTISNTTPRTITLNMETVPNGTLEIVQNTSGYIGERMEALSDAEIIEIMGGTGSE